MKDSTVFKLIGAAAILTAATYFGWVCYAHGEASGKEAGMVAGEAKGYVAGVKFGAEEQKRAQEEEKNAKLKFEPDGYRQDWREVEFKGKKMFTSNLAAPRPFPEPMNYFYAGNICYAFVPYEFSFEEIYEFFLKDSPKPSSDLTFRPPAIFI